MIRILIMLAALSISGFALEDLPQEENPTQKPQKIELLLDTLMSPKAAGTSMLNIHQGIESALNSRYNPEDSANPPLIRFTELLLGWVPLNQITTVTQHEIFGHGYRIRDLGEKIVTVKQYKLGIPTPYGPGGGATHFKGTKRYGPIHDTLVTIAGIEGTSVLAHELKTKWFNEGKIDPKQAYTYITAFHDPTFYVFSMDSKLSNAQKGHDLERYLCFIHTMYPGSGLTVNQLKALSLINCLDPMTYSCAKSMWHYIKTGQELPLPNQL